MSLLLLQGEASFVLVIQKHPKLVTYKAQAYHIKCLYQTGEQNVTLGFNVSMLTTAGTIANTGPPPTCLMKIVTHTGQEISAAEIGDNLMLQVDVQPASIYGGFARSCVAKTMEDKVENEYTVTDENGCATDPSIFGEWEYNPDTQSLLASFNAFKFPSSDNIRFQCNIRVCFGKCQPVSISPYIVYYSTLQQWFSRKRPHRKTFTLFFNCFIFQIFNFFLFLIRPVVYLTVILTLIAKNYAPVCQVNCRGYNAYGRRKRAIDDDNNTDLAVTGDLMNGQLREEITIESNAILTFERREERFIDPTEGKNVYFFIAH